jgi:5'(3')-deoxyribonucleotidase
MPAPKAFVFGVDLDGCVGDFYGEIRKIAAEWMDKPVEELTENVSYGLTEWGIDEFGGYERLHRFAVMQRGLFREMRPIKDAPKVLRRLSSRDIRIRIITHRLFLKYAHKESVAQTIDWLDRWDIPYWDLCFMKDKRATGANIYIDDAPENILALREQGEKVIVFANSTNTEMAPPRCATWEDVERQVLDALDDWKTGSRALDFTSP